MQYVKICRPSYWTSPLQAVKDNDVSRWFSRNKREYQTWSNTTHSILYDVLDGKIIFSKAGLTHAFYKIAVAEENVEKSVVMPIWYLQIHKRYFWIENASKNLSII